MIPHIKYMETFCEPCAGAGDLIKHLGFYDKKCSWASDIQPAVNSFINKWDAFNLDPEDDLGEAIITNPPWDRSILHEMIRFFPTLRPTWLLFDADWMHTVQAAQLVDTCAKVISIGRLKWIPDSKYTGKDNCCWYLFLNGHTGGPKFVGRTK